MSTSLEFGLFHEFPRRPEQSETAAFAEGIELVDAAELWLPNASGSSATNLV